MDRGIVMVLAGLGLAACTNQGAAPEAPVSGGAAGEMGPGYCETPPEDPNEMERWNELCFPGEN